MARYLWKPIRNILLSICLAMTTLSNSFAGDWSAEEKWMLAGASALHIMDWGQTRYISKNPDRFYELNPLLPDHPSLGEVNRHFLMTGLLMLSFAHFLPDYRKAILMTYIGIQTVNVTRNYTIGLRVSF
jgi:hypothetical protein